MRKKFFLLTMLTMAAISLFSEQVNASSSFKASMTQQAVYLEARYDDPNVMQDNPQRSPVQIPDVSLDGHTLTFDASCIGCTLRLVNDEGEVEYTTIITSDTLVLPSTLEGEFEIQIIRDNWCFYGYIEL